MVVSLSIAESMALYCGIFFISANILKSNIQNKMIKLFFATILPFLISGFRYNVGWDYGSYAWGFELFDPNIPIFELFKNYKIGDSVGLDLVMLLTKSLNSQFLFFALTAMFGLVPAFLYLLNDWDDEKNIISLAAFITCFTLLFTTYSAIKQGIAISFCLYSLRYVYKRNVIGFMLCITIAFLFHSTALIFVPVYFFWGNRNKVDGWKKICIIGVAIFFVVFIGEILQRFGGDRFKNYGIAIVATNNYSFYLMFALLTIYLIFRKKLILLDERNELLIILYTIAVIFMILGFKNAFTKRIASYFSVVQIILLPQLVFVFSKRSRLAAKILIGVYIILICMIGNTGTSENMAPIPYSFLFGA